MKKIVSLMLVICLAQTIHAQKKMSRPRLSDLQVSFNQIMSRPNIDNKTEESACTILTEIISDPIYNEIVNKIPVKEWVNDSVTRLSIKLDRAPICAPELTRRGIILPAAAGTAEPAIIPSSAAASAPSEITLPTKSTVPSAPVLPEPPIAIETKEQAELEPGKTGKVSEPGKEKILRESTKEPKVEEAKIQMPKPKTPTRLAPKPIKIEEGAAVRIPEGEKTALVSPKTEEEIKKLTTEQPSMGQIIETGEQPNLPVGGKGALKPAELTSEKIRRETTQEPTIRQSEMQIPLHQAQVPKGEMGTLVSPENAGKIQQIKTEEPTMAYRIEQGKQPELPEAKTGILFPAEELKRRRTEEPTVQQASKPNEERKATLRERIDYLATMARDSQDVEKLASGYGLTNKDGSANTIALVETLENFEQQIKDDARAISPENVTETEKTIKPYLATIRSNIDTYAKQHGQVSTELSKDLDEQLNALTRMVNESNNIPVMAEKYGAIQNGVVDTDLLLTNLDTTKKLILDASAQQSPAMRAQIKAKVDSQLQTIRNNIEKHKSARVHAAPELKEKPQGALAQELQERKKQLKPVGEKEKNVKPQESPMLEDLQKKLKNDDLILKKKKVIQNGLVNKIINFAFYFEPAQCGLFF